MNQPNITPEELRINYIRLAKVLHPDSNPDNPTAVQAFQELQTQYEKAEKILESKSHYQASISVTLNEAIRGCERFFINDDGNKFLLTIPAGVKNRQVVMYRGMAINSSKDSILDVKVGITLPSDYVIAGDKLIFNLRVPYWKLFFGGRHTFVGPDGTTIPITIPKNSKSGKMYRVNQHGFWNRVEKKRDSLYIQIFGCII